MYTHVTIPATEVKTKYMVHHLSKLRHTFRGVLQQLSYLFTILPIILCNTKSELQPLNRIDDMVESHLHYYWAYFSPSLQKARFYTYTLT